MSILEAWELNWTRYQINQCIEMDSNANSVVWLRTILLDGLLRIVNSKFMFGCPSS